jgi:hypothetical protein
MLFTKTPFSNTQDFDRVFQQTHSPKFHPGQWMKIYCEIDKVSLLF